MSEKNMSFNELVDCQKLQARQDELAQSHNIVIITHDLQGNLVTDPSYSAQYESSFSQLALQGLHQCLRCDLNLSRDVLNQGKKVFTSLFSGKITTAVIPLLENEITT